MDLSIGHFEGAGGTKASIVVVVTPADRPRRDPLNYTIQADPVPLPWRQPIDELVRAIPAGKEFTVGAFVKLESGIRERGEMDLERHDRTLAGLQLPHAGAGRREVAWGRSHAP